jgi:iron complex transport system ATP-binding protein
VDRQPAAQGDVLVTLSARNLRVELGGNPVLRGLDLALLPGQVTGLLGPNGAGKSTLIRSFAGLLPVQGRVEYRDRSLASIPAAERARAIAYLPQAREVNWPLTVWDTVMLGRIPHQAFGRAVTEADESAVRAALARLELTGFAGTRISALSGGELARVLAARALAQATPFLLADEPAAGLDPAHQIKLMSAFRQGAAAGQSILVSVHDLSLAARWCDRILLLKEGLLVADGQPEDVLTREALAAAYGVDVHITRDQGGMLLTAAGLAP